MSVQVHICLGTHSYSYKPGALYLKHNRGKKCAVVLKFQKTESGRTHIKWYLMICMKTSKGRTISKIKNKKWQTKTFLSFALNSGKFESPYLGRAMSAAQHYSILPYTCTVLAVNQSCHGSRGNVHYSFISNCPGIFYKHGHKHTDPTCFASSSMGLQTLSPVSSPD